MRQPPTDKKTEDWARQAVHTLVARRILLASNELRLNGMRQPADALMARYVAYENTRIARS